MKKYSIFLMATILVVLLLPLQSFAQAPDTLDVPERIDNNPLGAINAFINGDTTATGERNNPNRVYRLGREKIYLFNSPIVSDYPLTVIAEEPADPENPTRPPVCAPGILEDGSYPGVFFDAHDNLTVKGLYIHAFLPDLPGNQWSNGWIEPIVTRGDSCTYVLDNCIFDGCACAMVSKGYWQKLYLTNCRSRNGVAEATWYLGHFYLSDGLPVDTLIIVNNTIFNCGGFVNNNFTENYMLFEHNTIFTNHVNPFWAGGGTNRDMKNNIIYGVLAKGVKRVKDASGTITYDETGWVEYDNLPYSVTSIDTLEPALLEQHGMTESQRYNNWQNNAYFWPKAVTDFWASHSDSLYGPIWMNSRTEAMHADDVNYPNLHNSGNINADPGFNQDMMNQVDKVVNYCNMFVTNTMDVYRHYYPTDDPNAIYFPPPWPLAEDLTYSNETLKTASTLGLPLGDLNWYPEYLDNYYTGVKELKPGKNVPNNFTLDQNYPNPFNPVTTISFSLKKDAHVALAVYNLLGQKVKTLLDKEMLAGAYQKTWDGTDEFGRKLSSGIYYYRLETESQKATKKMLLMK